VTAGGTPEREFVMALVELLHQDVRYALGGDERVDELEQRCVEVDGRRAAVDLLRLCTSMVTDPRLPARDDNDST
jgi:hypothetical protein